VVRVVLACILASTVAHTPARADVPDPTLRAIKDRLVRLELDTGTAIEGRLLGYGDASITVARTGTNEVVTVPRSQLMRVIDSPVQPDRTRVYGIQSSLLGTVAVDAEWKRLRAFASMNVLLPVLTASSSSTWIAAAVGAGISLPLHGRWKLDVFGDVLPFHTTSFYTYLGFGVGAGVHWTGASGLTLGATLPLLGFATRIGSSPYNYDPSFRYNDSLGYYYLAGLAGLPLLTVGYRFAR
jgi:hypothetical protein